MGLYQQDTRARFLDSITVLHDSEELAKNLVQDLIARGLTSTMRTLDNFELEELPDQKIVLGGVHEQAGRISDQLQADPAEAPVSGSAVVRAGRCEVLRFRPERLHLQPVLCGRCRLRHPLQGSRGPGLAAGPGHPCVFLSHGCITRRLGKVTISDVDIITLGASRLTPQHADR